MKNKTCGECKHYVLELKRCNLRKIICNILTTDTACSCFECKPMPKPTNGDVIRQGGNEALVKYRQKFICHVCAYRFDKKCNGAKCGDGLMAWLNAPAESEGKDE